MKFISIYGDFGDSVGETIYMNAPALADEQIGEIMGEYLPSNEDTRRWSGFCDGSPRVARVVGLDLRSNPDDLLKAPDTVGLWDRYIVGGDSANSLAVERRRVVLRRLALFKRFAPGPSEGIARPLSEPQPRPRPKWDIFSCHRWDICGCH